MNQSSSLIKKRNGWIAFILSFFCAGLGHLYSGKLKKAIFLYFLANIFEKIILILFAFYPTPFIYEIFIIIIPALYLYITIDAIFLARKNKIFTLKSYNRWYIYIVIILISYFTFGMINSYLSFNTYQIPTGSMENTILVGDRIIENKFSYGIPSILNSNYLFEFNAPKRNDVIVYIHPGMRDEVSPKENIPYIKRIVGEPGDTLLIRRGVLYVNSQVFPNPPDIRKEHRPQEDNIVDPRIFPKDKGWNEDNYGPLIIPKKGDIIKLNFKTADEWMTFILRENHLVKIDDSTIYIDNKITNEYKVENDYYFIMGDNRNNSLDSRYWGFLPKEKITGKVEFIYWSWDPTISFFDFGKKIGSIRWNRIAKLIK